MEIPESVKRFLEVQCGNVDSKYFPVSYFDSLESKYKLIQHFLPDNPKNIVEIGGGMSGFSLLLAKLYPEATIHIVDGDKADPKFPGVKGVPFNDMSVVKEFFEVNGVSNFKTHVCSVDDIEQVDLCVSFASWGFHFPVEVYQDIFLKMNYGATLAIELRYQEVNPACVPAKLVQSCLTSYKKNLCIYEF